MQGICTSFAPDRVTLRPGIFQDRYQLNRAYMLSLKNDHLLLNFYLEAGLKGLNLFNTLHGSGTDDIHWGWESPTCQLRGHFLGHWLSAAGRLAAMGDQELKAKADMLVAELAVCQKRNGGEWLGSIPEKYLHWIAQGQQIWAPHYTLHKTLMGLWDFHLYTGSQLALDLADRFADWFHRWTKPFSRTQMDDILDVETGGMLEVWANLYGATGKPKYAELIERYTRARLFDPLLAGRDALTNLHANTTIPEIHGAARCYEVTGEARWRQIVEAYWQWAVTQRGTFCTGSQTAGEIWTPPFEFAARRGDKNQEFCVVYNMMRLADYLFRWTGEVQYADYIERNIYNGVLAQQHPRTGMVTYFLPLDAGARKLWGTPTRDFWCCHGTLVQAHTLHNAYIYYEDAEGLVVTQYLPSEAHTTREGIPVTITQRMDYRFAGAEADNSSAAGARHRPMIWVIEVTVTCAQPVAFTLKLRLPWWLSGPATLTLNGTRQTSNNAPSSFESIRRNWHNDTLRLEFPKALTTEPIPDEPNTVAFLDGPVVLAGLCGEERILCGDQHNPATILTPDNERQWNTWLPGYRTRGQVVGIRFKPLYEVAEEPYTVYFPIQPGPEH